jgi:hypothetical protein
MITFHITRLIQPTHKAVRLIIANVINLFRLNRFLQQFTVSRRMISFRSGSCLSKLERVKENTLKVFRMRE